MPNFKTTLILLIYFCTLSCKSSIHGLYSNGNEQIFLTDTSFEYKENRHFNGKYSTGRLSKLNDSLWLIESYLDKEKASFRVKEGILTNGFDSGYIQVNFAPTPAYFDSSFGRMYLIINCCDTFIIKAENNLFLLGAPISFFRVIMIFNTTLGPCGKEKIITKKYFPNVLSNNFDIGNEFINSLICYQSFDIQTIKIKNGNLYWKGKDTFRKHLFVKYKN
jgi:hypothetical protein